MKQAVPLTAPVLDQISNLEIKQLRRFLAVVRCGSLAGAAPELGLTQQALGAGIARLEEELGVVLFDRGPGGATSVTPYGTLLIRHAKHILAAADRAREELLAYRDARGGSVTIGVGEAFPHEVIADAVRECHRTRPEIRISLIEDYSDLLLDKLAAGEVDFIAGADTAAAGIDVERFLLYALRDIVIVRAEHPLVNRPRLRLRDLQAFTWMLPRARPADAALITEAFRNQDLDPPARFIFTDAPNVGMRLLLAEDYIFMTSPAQVTAPLRDGLLVALNTKTPSVERRVGLLFRTDTRLNPSALLLMEDIRHRVHSHIDALRDASPLNPGRKVSDAA
jgi:DNA-binding transcriptional LysR family regulator